MTGYRKSSPGPPLINAIGLTNCCGLRYFCGRQGLAVARLPIYAYPRIMRRAGHSQALPENTREDQALSAAGAAGRGGFGRGGLLVWIFTIAFSMSPASSKGRADTDRSMLA